MKSILLIVPVALNFLAISQTALPDNLFRQIYV